MLKLVILDFDGTLASSLAGIHLAMAATLVHHGFPEPTADAIRGTIGLPLDESIRLLTSGQCAASIVSRMVDHYRSLHDSLIAPHTVAFEGARETLAVLRDLGIRSAVVSNRGKRGLGDLMNRLELASLVDLALGATEVRFPKPDARLFTEHIFPVLPFAPDEVLVVGDTVTDLHFAANIGAKSCWARYGYGDHVSCSRLSPDFAIDTFGELPAVLNQQAAQPAKA